MTLKGSKTPKQQRTIVFVLGGPGSGKGTQARSPTGPGMSACSECLPAVLFHSVLQMIDSSRAVQTRRLQVDGVCRALAIIAVSA